MTTKPGQVYKVDLGIKGKVRYMVVVSREDPNAQFIRVAEIHLVFIAVDPCHCVEPLLVNIHAHVHRLFRVDNLLDLAYLHFGTPFFAVWGCHALSASMISVSHCRPAGGQYLIKNTGCG